MSTSGGSSGGALPAVAPFAFTGGPTDPDLQLSAVGDTHTYLESGAGHGYAFFDDYTESDDGVDWAETQDQLNIIGAGNPTATLTHRTSAGGGIYFVAGSNGNILRVRAKTGGQGNPLLSLDDVGGNQLLSVNDSGALEFTEQADPVAPVALRARVYARDSGGKVQLVVRFPTGAVQQIAIEP